MRLTGLLTIAILGFLGSSSAQTVKEQTLVERFYRARGGKPAWTESGDLKFSAFPVLNLIRRASEFGLNPSDYLLDDLEILLNESDTVTEAQEDRYWWRIDSLFTVAAFRFFRDAVEGRVRAEAVDAKWTSTNRSINWVTRMNAAADSGRISEVLDEVQPDNPGYRVLRSALARYQSLADNGGWDLIADGPLLKPGAVSDRLPALRRRLHAEGYLATPEAERPDDFDYQVAVAVIQFQRTHGLPADGVVGPQTVAELNVPASRRVEQIGLNLERWRWLPRQLGDRYLMVNIAGAELDLVDSGRTIDRYRAIVGRVDWRTPIVSSTITHALFRPVWRIPRSIAISEILRIVKKNPDYLRREHIKVYGEESAEPLDPAGIDWSNVSRGSFRYRFAQEPGPTNPLGGAKLVFASPFRVYLHDTPFQAGFAAPRRLESHGCVRVEGMPRLLGLLLPRMTEEEIAGAMAEGRDRAVELDQPIALHLVYWTAWVDDSGQIQLRHDPYGWDRELGEAIARQSQLRAGLRIDERITASRTANVSRPIGRSVPVAVRQADPRVLAARD